MPFIPGENSGTPARRESSRSSFVFPSGKNASASLASKHFGDLVGKSDFGGSEALDKTRQQYNAGE